MKNILLTLTIMSCIFASRVEASQQKSFVSKQREGLIKQVVAQNERQMLLNKCAEIKAVISQRFAGGGKGSAHRDAIKRGLTDYLTSVGTPTARQLLGELQANGFGF